MIKMFLLGKPRRLCHEQKEITYAGKMSFHCEIYNKAGLIQLIKYEKNHRKKAEK